MVKPTAAQGLRQRLGHMFLADHLGECPRPVLAVERERHSPSQRRLASHAVPTGRPPHNGDPGATNWVGNARNIARGSRRSWGVRGLRRLRTHWHTHDMDGTLRLRRI
ncbi:hypothetical protein Ais01nite_32280 [Asanoa ishikariensis]|nr:hypothetical protein Ais01nite_32280 [Asanoa ishikariensis]